MTLFHRRGGGDRKILGTGDGDWVQIGDRDKYGGSNPLIVLKGGSIRVSVSLRITIMVTKLEYTYNHYRSTHN